MSVPRTPLAVGIDGLSMRRSGETLESVSTRSGRLGLLVSSGMEIVEGTLAAGERITLLPSEGEGEDAVEVYYLLSGRLTLVDDSRDCLLGAGDYVVTRRLSVEAIFHALEEVRFLYFTSKPFFHQISSELQELMSLAVEVELKDGYTAEHCLRLQRLSFATGRELGLAPHQLHMLDHAAYLHDLGKVKVPIGILQKPGSLTPPEWEVIKKHPSFGREILEPTYIREAGEIVEQHHERLDGSGYPFGLSRDDILTESYIVAIADAYDAMTTDRSYRKAMPPAEARAELLRFSSVHYPKELVSAFLSTLDKVEPQRL